MDLRNIRINAVKWSGRYDLVKTENGDTWVDNGMNAFINAGQNVLDLRVPMHSKSAARHVESVVAGTYLITFLQCRWVDRVWTADAEGNLTELEHLTMNELRTQYGEDFSLIDQGAPKYYTPTAVGLSPDQEDLDETDFVNMHDWHDLVFGNHYGYDAVVILPPPDETYTVSIWGHFFSTTLTNDGDYSHWTVKFPYLLIKSTLATLESFYRNAEGFRAWEEAMASELLAIDADAVEREVATIDQMKG